jgi:hypothetical protein
MGAGALRRAGSHRCSTEDFTMDLTVVIFVFTYIAIALGKVGLMVDRTGSKPAKLWQ